MTEMISVAEVLQNISIENQSSRGKKNQCKFYLKD
jgi:hypothetical protein